MHHIKNIIGPEQGVHTVQVLLEKDTHNFGRHNYKLFCPTVYCSSLLKFHIYVCVSIFLSQFILLYLIAIRFQIANFDSIRLFNLDFSSFLFSGRWFRAYLLFIYPRRSSDIQKFATKRPLVADIFSDCGRINTGLLQNLWKLLALIL